MTWSEIKLIMWKACALEIVPYDKVLINKISFLLNRWKTLDVTTFFSTLLETNSMMSIHSLFKSNRIKTGESCRNMVMKHTHLLTWKLRILSSKLFLNNESSS